MTSKPVVLALAAALSLGVEAAPARSLSSNPDVAARLRAAEAWLGTQLARDGVPGASVAIVHDQQMLWSRGYGHANVKGKVPATASTRYSICSISKLFTSMAAMRERDAGRLDIDAPVSRYLNWYNVRDVEKADGPVTARGIMSHVAGLPRESDLPYWREAKFPDIAAVRARLGEQSNLYQPYSVQQYSNLGMTLLGEMIAATSKQGYHDYISTNFLRPLGLTGTTSELPVERHGKDFAIGYTSRQTGWSRAPFPAYKLNAIAPAAGFASTVEDLGKLASWQFRLLEKGGEDVLRASTLREMQRVHWMTPDKPDETWGLGFSSFMHNGKSFVGHSGYCPGYRSVLMMRPQDKLAVILLTNADDANTGRLVRELYDLVGPDIAKAAKATKAPEPRKANFAAFEGVYGSDRTASDLHVAQVGEELVSVGLYSETNAAKNAVRWRHQGGNVFRRIREDDSLGDELRFDMDASGRAARLWIHSNPLDRRSP
jgi:CubicO group peptidase (beta-lactamase class C family)